MNQLKLYKKKSTSYEKQQEILRMCKKPEQVLSNLYLNVKKRKKLNEKLFGSEFLEKKPLDVCHHKINYTQMELIG